MTRGSPAPDQKARDRATREFGLNFVVTAGAGSGKTSLLVERALNLLLSGRVEPKKMVALTFTEKAAAQLGQRLGEALDEIRGHVADNEALESSAARNSFSWLQKDKNFSRKDLVMRIDGVLASMDQMTLTTIHGFCSDILRTWPREAGVDPYFKVDTDGLGLDEALAASWARFLRNLPESEAMPWADGSPESYLGLARDLAPPQIPAAFLLDSEGGAQIQREELKSLVRRVLDRSKSALDAWRPLGRKNSKFGEKMDRVCEGLKTFLEAGSLEPAGPMSIPEAGKHIPEELHTRLAEAAREGINMLEQVGRIDADRVRAEVRRAGSLALEARKSFFENGYISFDAMLSKTRDLLRDHKSIRELCKKRYDCFLLDEFQDTDPLQYEILFFMAEVAGEYSLDGYQCRLVPGKLFCVGDPKQAIFTFRGADLNAYEKCISHITHQGGEVLQLTSNFRSVPEILEPAGRLMSALMHAEAGVQPAYEPLQPTRNPAGSPRLEVWVLPQTGSAHDRRQQEARAIASRIRNEQAQGLPYKEMALLLRTFGSLEIYVQALHEAGIPFVVSGGKTFSNRREIVEIQALLKILSGEPDPLSLVTVLRSSIGACPDGEMARFVKSGHSWILDETPDAGDYPNIARTWDWIRKCLDETASLPQDQAIDKALEISLVWFGLAASFEGSRKAANVRKFIEGIKDRIWSAGVSLKEALDQEAMRAVSDESESPLADDSLDAVRILTIHKAKGLEFDLVFLANLAGELKSDSRGKSSWVALAGVGGQVALAVELPDGTWNEAAMLRSRNQIKRQDAENLRLIYVAMTRARNRLILPAYNRDSLSRPKGTLMESLEWLDAWGFGKPKPARDLLFVKDFPEPKKGDKDIVPNAAPLVQAAQSAEALGRSASKESFWRRTASQNPRGAERHLEWDAGGEPSSALEPKDLGAATGTVIHQYLERSGLNPDLMEDSLLRLLVEQAAQSQAVPADLLEDECQSVLKGPGFKKTLALLADLKPVGFELPIIYKNKAEEVCEGRIDFLGRKDEEVWVVDWKTDRADSGALLEKYRDQMEFYLEGVRPLVGPTKKVRGFLASLREGKLIEV